MPNIIDFILLQGGKTFAEKPFCPVDAAVLSQLSYLKFEHIDNTETLLATLGAAGRERLFEDERFGEDQRRLYFEAAFSVRYQSMKVRDVQSVKNDDSEVCFCAMVFEPEGCAPVVVFRGTDEFVVGWKEDFAMAYRCPVPAQTLSVDYLAEAAAGRREFYVCGHSKGGNLAEYSVLHSGAELRSRVKMVYDFDGPGFASSVLDMPEYTEMGGRIMKIVPRQSFVGQLLRSDAIGHRVDSDGAAIFQHDIFNWRVDSYGDFIYTDDESVGLSTAIGRLNANIAKLSADQLERFVDALFAVLKDADIDNLVDFSKNWRHNSRRILSAYNDLDETTKELLGDTVAELIFG
ncbi:MAG: DUF2974 domain-containing protein [Oscillospiraceae bacterium]|nr:DUF2974 domain-containing protein [Oscillospiraceae bacterium]